MVRTSNCELLSSPTAVIMKINTDILATLFEDPYRVRQLMMNGYKVVIISKHLDRLVQQSRYRDSVKRDSVGILRNRFRLYFMFVPPVTNGYWNRHVDMYLNDVMNTPEPMYNAKANRLPWFEMKVKVSYPWMCMMVNNKLVRSPRSSVDIHPIMIEDMVSNSAVGPYTYFGIITEMGFNMRKSMYNLTNREMFVSARDNGAAVLITDNEDDDDEGRFKKMIIYT